MKKSFQTDHISAFLRRERGILILMGLILAAHVFFIFKLGPEYSLVSDDAAYISSGLYFAKTGTVTVHNEYPTAQIMPGITYLIAIPAFFLGDGKALWTVLKLLWALMGTVTAWFLYRSVCLFAPRWCGLVAAACQLGIQYIWMDNLILTETPSILCLSIAVYCTLSIGRSQERRYRIGFAAAYLAGVMIRANFISFPIFAACYLLLIKYDWKLLIKQGAVLFACLACFLLPWTIRNYLQFHTFMPLSYGAGNPMLLGTYQGVGYPQDDTLDYETNVEMVVRERYAYYYGEDGSPLPRYAQFVQLKKDSVKASYRLREWARRDLGSLLYSTLIIKPAYMIRTAFYWDNITSVITFEGVAAIQRVDTVLCAVTAALAFFLKKFRPQVVFLSSVYLGNVLICSLAFSFERYNASLMCLRMMLLGLGAGLLVELLRRLLSIPLAPADAPQDRENGQGA